MHYFRDVVDGTRLGGLCVDEAASKVTVQVPVSRVSVPGVRV